MEPFEISNEAEDFLNLQEEARETCPTCELTIKCQECRLYIDPDKEYLMGLNSDELKEEYGCRKFDGLC